MPVVQIEPTLGKQGAGNCLDGMTRTALASLKRGAAQHGGLVRIDLNRTSSMDILLA